MKNFKLNDRYIGEKGKVYFIADIAANHDGSLSRAKKLIKLCYQSGANAAKFQHFNADTIVSDYGFSKLGKFSHQKKWKKSVYNVYKNASINLEWTKHLFDECKKYKIDFISTPYDLGYVDYLYKYIPAYKIGSGDITWHELITKIAKKNKPVFIAVGASKIEEVKKAVSLIKKYNNKIVLMQCNTNYTASNNNYKFLNLQVLRQFKKIYKDNIITGLSDHTFGHNSVLGAVALGAKVIEKHFTDSNFRNGPDHKFSMNPVSWKKMVDEVRKLESSLGDGLKKIELNEFESAIIQRRAIRAKFDIFKGQSINHSNIIPLRPCPKNGLEPYKKYLVLKRKAKKFIRKGDVINCVNTK